jgi:hypothetical protein
MVRACLSISQPTKDRLKLLLFYGMVLTVDHLLHRDDLGLMFSTIHQAHQLAESTHDATIAQPAEQPGDVHSVSYAWLAHNPHLARCLCVVGLASCR